MLKMLRYVIVLGSVLTLAGVVILVLGVFRIVDLAHFAFGLSAGVRIVGSVAIAGCLLCAIGHGLTENIEHSPLE